MTVRVEGAEIFYSSRGGGPVCLVPTAIGTRPYESQMPPPLTDRFRFIYVDLRGSGRSSGEPTALTFDVLADDLEAVRADLGAERVCVLGHSILGLLAIEYGRRRPDSVSHVITVGTPPRGDMRWLGGRASAFFEEDASEERKELLRDNLARLPADASLMERTLAETPRRFYDPRFDAAPFFAEAIRRPELLGHVLGSLAPTWDVALGSSSLRVPLLIAHGRYDYVVPHILWDEVAPRLPGATLHVFERSGHQPFLEEPDRFASVVGDWMSEQKYPLTGI